MNREILRAINNALNALARIDALAKRHAPSVTARTICNDTDQVRGALAQISQEGERHG